MPYYPQELIEEIREKNDILDVIGSRVKLKKQGSYYFGLCPFHHEKSPSFAVTPSNQMFYCFGCHESGNVVSFVMKYENYTFTEAVQMLAERANIKLPEIKYTEEMRREADKRERLMEIVYEAEKYFYHQLRSKDGELGKKYLTDRALTEETMQHFGLGYSLQYSNDLVRYLKHKGYDDELIRESGLGIFYEREGMTDKFINRVMFPIQNIHDKVIGFGGRVMGDAKPKYLNSPESEIFEKRKNLYGLNYARVSRKDNFILCEGYMDVIALHQAGFNQAVASLGTAFTPEQAMLLKRFSKNVLLAYDSDGAGVNAALKALAILSEMDINGRVIDMRPYKDPDEFIKNLGAEEFQKRIDHAENGFLFEVRQRRAEYVIDAEHPDNKAAFARDVATMLCRFEEEIERESYLTSVSEQYGIDAGQLRKAVISLAGRDAGNKKILNLRTKDDSDREIKAKKEEGAAAAAAKAQRLLLNWLAKRPELFDHIGEDITEEDFTDPLYRVVAGKLFDQIVAGKVTPVSIMDGFEDKEDQRRVGEIFFTEIGGPEREGLMQSEEISPEDKAKAFHDVIVNIKKNSIEKLAAESGSSMESLDKLLKAKRTLQVLETKKYTI